MSWTKRIESMRSSIYAVAILALAITVLWGGAQFNTTTVEASVSSDAPSAHMMFPGQQTNVAIPDGTTGCTGSTPGPNADITFNVTGITGTVTDIWVTADITHSWVGDLGAYLIAPDATTHILFERTGRTTATSCGDSSNLAGAYRFIDNATGTNWWTESTLGTSLYVMTPGDYRTTAPAPQPATTNAPTTVITTAFASVANPNGIWRLRVNDYGSIDTGTINSATLAIAAGTTPAPAAQYLDFFGNNLTDFAIFTFPTAGGQLRYRIAKNDNPTTATSPIIDQNWGQTATDAVPNQGNYIGDARTDFNLYRVNSGSPANTYLIAENDSLAAKNTAYIRWGNSTTDLVGAEGDYNGDGLLDPTVVRDSNGTATGGSLIWYILNSGTNTVTSFNYGTDTDIPLAGANYTGSVADDPTVVRIGAGGQITYLVGTTTGTVASATDWGNFNTDFVVPGGDYDGDGFADFMVWRAFGAGTNGVWYLRTATGTTAGVPFGTPGAAGTRDTALRGGDYDGDGKDDIAVYRPGTTTFMVLRSSNGGTIMQQWGVPGNSNLPIASFGVQ